MLSWRKPGREYCPRCWRTASKITFSVPEESCLMGLPPLGSIIPTEKPDLEDYRRAGGRCELHTLILWNCPDTRCGYSYFAFLFHEWTVDRYGGHMGGNVPHQRQRPAAPHEPTHNYCREIGSHIEFEEGTGTLRRPAGGPHQPPHRDHDPSSAAPTGDQATPWHMDPGRGNDEPSLQERNGQHLVNRAAGAGAIGNLCPSSYESGQSSRAGAAGTVSHSGRHAKTRRRQDAASIKRTRDSRACDWCRKTKGKCADWHPGHRRPFISEWDKMSEEEKVEAAVAAMAAAEAVCDFCREANSLPGSCDSSHKGTRTRLGQQQNGAGQPSTLRRPRTVSGSTTTRDNWP